MLNEIKAMPNYCSNVIEKIFIIPNVQIIAYKLKYTVSLELNLQKSLDNLIVCGIFYKLCQSLDFEIVLKN